MHIKFTLFNKFKVNYRLLEHVEESKENAITSTDVLKKRRRLDKKGKYIPWNILEDHNN